MGAVYDSPKFQHIFWVVKWLSFVLVILVFSFLQLNSSIVVDSSLPFGRSFDWHHTNKTILLLEMRFFVKLKYGITNLTVD